MNGVRDAVGIFITLPMLLLCSWAQVIPTQPLVDPFTEEEYDPFIGFSSAGRDVWNETPFNDIAVSGGFTQTSYMDYSDVAVLINNESEASRTIGWAFVTARNISMDNVLLFDNGSTPTGETINRDQFNTYFVEPFREWVNESSHRKNEINYLVTTKGIPLRVNGGNNKVSFDNEIALIEGDLEAEVDKDWWTQHSYGPFFGDGYESFSKGKHGFYLVTRLTGYTVETALGLIEKANASLGSRGNFVLDLATNRNGSGYKYWNDDLYAANSTLNGTMDLPVNFNQNGTFLTNISNIIAYASWGSNDDTWGGNFLPNAGFDTSDSSWDSGSKYWSSMDPPTNNGETFEWNRQTAVKRNGNAALEGVLTRGICTASSASETNGLLAEYFDNAGITFNTSLMPDLSSRTPDFIRIESVIDQSDNPSPWTGLDNRFKDYFSVRHTGYLTIPESGNWSFHLGSDDGSKLWIDGQEVIDNKGIHGHTELSSNASWYDAGQYHVRTEMFEHGGWASIDLSWSGPNMSKSLIANQYWAVGDNYSIKENDLLHHWGFDENSGTTVSDSKSYANLTIQGTAAGSNWATGVAGGAYHFDGVDEFAKVDVDDWGGNFSISMWVKTNNDSQNQYASAIAVNDVAGDNSSFQFQFSGGSNGDWQTRNSGTYDFGVVVAGEWTNLAMTFENGSMKQYLNGVHVRTTNFPNNSIDNIQLYKFGVNRAGNTYYEGQIDEVSFWNSTLNSSEILEVNRQIAVDCPDYSQANNATTHIEQDFEFDDELKGHAWIIYGYAMKDGWFNGDYRIVVDSYAENGTLMTTNTSNTNSFASDWNSRTMRFRPHHEVVNFSIRMEALIGDGTYNGSIYFDTMNLRAIRPHMGWVDGSIAETAVSTGGRSFNWGTGYGQSLVADLLEDGVSGVKGYVYEPYLTAVAYPSVMTTAYASGYTWAESIYMANPQMSWMGVVVGDPKMAAFADILHDANISDVRAIGTPTKGRISTLEVLIENLAPSMGNGTIEIRERQGNALVGMAELSLTPGDQAGSRVIVGIEITPQRSGYTEFVVRWVNDSGFNERLLENNVVILNLLVNEPPSVTDAFCQSNIIYRGSSFTCSAVVSDDVGITATEIGWRIKGNDGIWTQETMASAGTSDNLTWWTGVSIPVNSTLGWLELIVVAWDTHGYNSTEIRFSNISEVVDAIANWHGPHIQGVDDDDWSGITSIPQVGSGLARGEDSEVKVCVLDADHDSTTQSPNMSSELGIFSPVSIIQTSTPGLTCYSSTLSIPIGGNLGPIEVGFTSADGSSITRSITLGNKAPQPVMELRNSDNQSIDFATGAVGEAIWVEIDDPDDPNSSAYGDLVVMWPGHIDRIASVEIEDGQSGVLIELPYPVESLEQGMMEVELSLHGAHGSHVEVSESWSVLLAAPLGLHISICNIEGEIDEQLIRGHQSIATLYVQSHRPMANSNAVLTQSGWSVPASQLEEGDNPGVCLDEIESATHMIRFRVMADSSFIEGEVILTITFTDMDGLMVQRALTLDVDRSIPTMNITAPEEVIVGDRLEVSTIVKDLDGIQGTECTFIINDKEQREVFSMSKEVQVMDEQEGVVIFQYPTPKVNSSVNQPPWQVSVYCIDADGDRGEAALSHLIAAIQPPECVVGVDCVDDDDDSSKEKVSSGLSTQNTILGIGGVMMIIIIVVLSLMMRRRNEEEAFDPWSQNRGSEHTHDEDVIQQHQNILQEQMQGESVQEEQQIQEDFSEVLDDII